MAIIGKLIQRTTAISYKRNAKKGIEYKYQLEVLRMLLEQSKNTKFGFVHSFHDVLKKADAVSEYQKYVPLTDYDKFKEEWLQETIDGAKDHTWKGKIKFFALSSGTTGSPSKRIPVTIEMIRSFQRTSLRQFSVLHELDLPEEFYGSSLLTVGGSTKLTKVAKHIEGDLSGILRKHTSLVVTPFTKPGKRITDLKTWNEKLEAIIEKAPIWNIGIIAGIPSWCILLMEKIVAHYQLDSIHDIWPNLQVYVHGGVFMDPYIERLEKLSKKKIYLLDTYLASEGYFAYQMSPKHKGMKLLLNNGIFYEFIPFNSDYFNEDGRLKDQHNALTISQIQAGIDYALVISTNAGLWRYLIGDLVRFVDIEEREIVITGRIRQFLSLCGEHLSLDNINQALMALNSEKGISVNEFTIYADIQAERHVWYLGIDKEVMTQNFVN
ncbi:MAG: GH3 auxin-responsive promoter [Crocinitomicaceae bacterium]|nr:GH3 auxin-responsive promoter [Crocinitomicaceae bacterium]